MSRPLLLRLSAWAKKAGLTDFVIRRNPYLRRRVTYLLHRFYDQSPRRQQAISKKLLRRALRFARSTGYGTGKPARLEDWPILHKESLRAAPEDYYNHKVRFAIPTGTGGTTGVPLKLRRSMECIVAEQMFLDDLLAPHGYSMHRSRLAILRADIIEPSAGNHWGYWTYSHGKQRLTLSNAHLSPQTFHRYHEELKKFAPQIIWAYPSAILNLVRLMAETGESLKIPLVMTSSEGLAAHHQKRLETCFGGVVINYYGQAERVCFACSTKPGEFRFDPRYGRVELHPCDNDKNRARIIATGYWNAAMPLVRYDTGDMIHIPDGCSAEELALIARGDRPFIGLDGRDGEYVVTADGMHIIGLNHIPREVPNVLQMQIVQDDFSTIKINVIALPEFNDNDATAIAVAARTKLPHGMNITVHTVDQLHKTARGKVPLIIRTLD